MMPKLIKVKYVPVENAIAEWVDKDGMIKRYEGLTRHTLTRWLMEMRDSPEHRAYVINPSVSLVWINIEGFNEFLRWRELNYLKNQKTRRKLH